MQVRISMHQADTFNTKIIRRNLDKHTHLHTSWTQRYKKSKKECLDPTAEEDSKPRRFDVLLTWNKDTEEEGGLNPEGHSNMKVTYKCLPENESMGIRCKISLKKGGHSEWTPKKYGIFFDVDSQNFSVQKCNFKPKFAYFMLKLPQNLLMYQNLRKARKKLQFVCKLWYESGTKGVIGCGPRKTGDRGVIGCKIGVERGSIDRHLMVSTYIWECPPWVKSKERYLDWEGGGRMIHGVKKL